MLIGLATHTVNAALPATLVCLPSTDLGRYARRVSRLATLDGGVATVDAGFTHGDRTVVLRLDAPSASTVTLLKALVTLTETLMVFLPDGAYNAVPESLTDGAGGVVLTLWLTGAAENVA
jgi:hypothetical protein